MIAIRRMASSALARLAEIDRSEHVTQEYTHRRGVLEAHAIDLAVPSWDRTGAGEHSVQTRIREWQPILERGGTLLGALDGERLAGLAIYRPRLANGMANLAVLHVTRSHRRRGVASRLTAEVARLARADGARQLYVSATPSGSAVGFYRSQGFVPTEQPDAALFALEPDDIHMVLAL
jgi:ribosomal protein S18 acetylase RimI-like enzyme